MGGMSPALGPLGLTSSHQDALKTPRGLGGNVFQINCPFLCDKNSARLFVTVPVRQLPMSLRSDGPWRPVSSRLLGARERDSCV